jgi:hypothetical protein
MEWVGFSLGMSGHRADAPAHFAPREREAFAIGNAAGFREFEDDEMARWEPEPAEPVEIHHAEMVEGAGVNYARGGDWS